MFKTLFSEDEKVSILAHVSPKELQQSIFMHSDALNSYSKMREHIEQYLVNKNVWKRPHGSQFGLTKVANKVDDGGPMPMDIGEFPKEKVPRVTKEKAKVEKEKVTTTRVEKETRPGNGNTATKVLKRKDKRQP